MTEFILGFLIFILGSMLTLLWMQVGHLRRRVEGLEESGVQPVAPVVKAVAKVEPPLKVAAKATGQRAAVVTASAAAPPPPEPAARPAKPEKPPRPAFNFEQTVGGKLPIWVGGIALVFAGFFLVRYTIEAGLFGPGARSVTATLFAFLMIALAETGGRLPKIGEAFKADPRVGQALAGAGVAVLYGTLYMASEIYGLVVLPTSFLLVIAVTVLAFFLALRHGPPTALMGLAGGFAAPWVAGMGADSMPALLLYLAVFISALFGLAIWRRWLWLLVLASGGGAIWSFVLLVTATTTLPMLGTFILFSGAAAVIALYRFPTATSGWAELARYVPMALALVQLAILLPRMDFSATGWLFYAALSALAIAFAWRDSKMIAAVAGALLLAIAPLAGAWWQHGNSNITPPAITLAATFGIALLFGGAGHAGARKPGGEAKMWALIALAAPLVCWFTAAISALWLDDFHRIWWGATALLAAFPCAWLAWDWHRRVIENKSFVQFAATASTTWLAGAALFCWIDNNYTAAILAAITLGVAAWAQVTGNNADRRFALLPLTLAFGALAIGSLDFINAFGASLSGAKELMAYLPGMSEAARNTLLPALMILALTWQSKFATGSKTRMACFAAGGAGVLAFLWLLAKQPAGIATPADFIRLGFAERAVFTQLLFAGSWLAFRQYRARTDWPSLALLGKTLCAIAFARFVWFDLILLNPAWVAQSLGHVPIANLGTVHTLLVAGWLWLLSREADIKHPLLLQIGSMGAMIAMALVTVRQAVQGSIISHAFIDIGENYLYSAALLVLGIIWLVRGMTLRQAQDGARMLRLAGLGLLTAVTLKVFLIDAAALTGLLRILSFLGLGIALIGIGWAYGRVMGTVKGVAQDTDKV